MVSLRIKINPNSLQPLSGSISQAIKENMMEIHYLDYYNLQHLIKRFLDKHHSLTTFDPFKPQRQKITIKININEGDSYRTLMLMQSIIWENDYLSGIHRDLIDQIDRQISNINKII